MTGIALPPSDFEDLELVIEPIALNRLQRIARRDPASHLHFRRDAAGRFDAPDGSFGVLYAAFDLDTAFVEAVLRDRPMRAPPPSIPLDYADLESRVVLDLEGQEGGGRVRLIKLYDEGLVAARIDNLISAVDQYSTTQRWAQAFHHHPVNADGIVYMSRFLGARRSVVLFERARASVGLGRVTPLLDHPDLPRILDAFRVSVDPP